MGTSFLYQIDYRELTGGYFFFDIFLNIELLYGKKEQFTEHRFSSKLSFVDYNYFDLLSYL